MIRYAPIDKPKVKNLIAQVQENIQELEQLTAVSFEEFHKDRKNYGSTEHHLRRALEGVLTIGTHLLSRIPSKTKDYQEIVLSLAKANVIPTEFAEQNKKLAGYRNRLVHLYWEVTEQELYDVTIQHVKDLDEFCSYFLEYVRKVEKET
jgi:uncharacterized protein YutE (UPF0331/DUF86 family)